MLTALFRRFRSGTRTPVVASRRLPLQFDRLEDRSLPSSAGGNVVLDWNAAALDAIRADRTPPPVAARALAIVHVAMYEAVEARRGGGVYDVPEVDAVRVRGRFDEGVAAAAAADRVLDALFPAHAATFDAQYQDYLGSLRRGQRAAVPASESVGIRVADLVLAWRADDGSQDTVSYQPGGDLGDWQPTPAGYAAALLPQWGGVTPFALDNAAQFAPAGPPSLDSEAFAAAYNEVKAYGSIDSTVRTADQTEIAKFWADGAGTATPPGHWNEIAAGVAADRHLNLRKAAELFAALNVAVADAGIACWDVKFSENLWRPVTAVRAGDDIGNAGVTGDAGWTPLLSTPPFPSYVSGHSTFSAAAATVLTAFFGPTYHFSTTSDGLPGVSRSFTSFTQAAAEAGQSRIYGGIHYQFDNTDGLAMGAQIGRLVLADFGVKARR